MNSHTYVLALIICFMIAMAVLYILNKIDKAQITTVFHLKALWAMSIIFSVLFVAFLLLKFAVVV